MVRGRFIEVLEAALSIDVREYAQLVRESRVALPVIVRSAQFSEGVEQPELVSGGSLSIW